jgi:prepilin-type N-terminal cleavage/methylation domain-containing protein
MHQRIGEQGFSLLQLLMVLAIVGVLSAIAVIKIDRSRESIKLSNSVRLLAANLESARTDAISRHGVSTVSLNADGTTYTVQMDFDGTGTVTSRTFPLDQGVRVITEVPATISFGLRGRLTTCPVVVALQSLAAGSNSNIDVGLSGDITVDSTLDQRNLPTDNYAAIGQTADVAPRTTIPGTTVHNNATICTEGASGSAITVTGSGSNCTVSANPATVSVRKSGGSTATISVSASQPGNMRATGPSNLNISPASQYITGGGAAMFTVSSNDGTRGTFITTFDSPCTTVSVKVNVTN